jgi:hypothetical protein
MSITHTQYDEAMEAADLIATAAALIDDARKQLDKVPSRFMAALEAIDLQEAVNTDLVDALAKLSDRISLDADYASERAA